jgi:predicted PurR-regulated permease PerM
MTTVIPPWSDPRDGLDGSSVTQPILAVIVATVVLYFSKDILLLLAIASILAVAFSPITSRLGTFIGHSSVRPWLLCWR